ncbi:unnamed protein product [Chrysoparadoxa australica]
MCWPKRKAEVAQNEATPVKKTPPTPTYWWLYRDSRVADWVKWAVGTVLLVVFGPYTALQIILCQLWELLDKRVIGLNMLCSRMNRAISPYLRQFIHHRDDTFMISVFVLQGILLPMWFFYELWRAAAYGLEWRRVVAYNLVRIGPMYCNFMYSYTLAHKEAHCFGKLFAFRNRLYLFNCWVGLFHGIVPGVFPYSHIFLHHKYNNAERDICSTAFRRRDRFSSWIIYSIECLLFATNISSAVAFWGEGDTYRAAMSTLGSMAYSLFVALCWRVHPMFTFATLVYCLIESNFLLSIVNYVWHAFIDPSCPKDPYVNSTTIMEGLNFTMSEEFHVVHHQVAGAHWTRHEDLLKKDIQGYKGRGTPPTAFYRVNIFEVFAHIVAADYNKLVEIYYKPWQGDYTDEELAELMRTRLQCHGPDLAKLMTT